MGAETRILQVADCATPALLQQRWRQLQDNDNYKRGHGAYQGSLGAVHDLDIASVRYPSLQAATAAAQAKYVDKRCAIAFGYGEPTKAFPVTSKDRQLVAQAEKLRKELGTFEYEVLKRFLQGKSKTKTCSGCGSAISQKSRKPLLVTAPDMTQHPTNYQAREQAYGYVSCPACHGNLLMTDTDKKRKEALTRRYHEAITKETAAKRAYLAKQTPPGYVIAATVAT